MRAGTRRWIVAVVAVIASAACIPGPAQARALPFHLQDRADVWKQAELLFREQARPRANGSGFDPSFEIRRGDGYKVVVTAAGDSVAVMVGRGNGALTVYLARGIATSRRLKASFGAFGKVDMRFHPSANQPPPKRGCRRRNRVKRRGTWTGSFRFAGEGGYISIDAHRAAGQIRGPNLPCSRTSAVHHRPQATSSGDPFSSFSLRQSFGAGWHHRLESAEVIGLERRKRTLYFAFAQQAFDRVGILRIAVAVGKAATFTVNDALTHAEASPPQPFHGTGTYTAAPDGAKSWLGDLTVNFPGTPRFPLAGEQFKVEVERPL